MFNGSASHNAVVLILVFDLCTLANSDYLLPLALAHLLQLFGIMSCLLFYIYKIKFSSFSAMIEYFCKMNLCFVGQQCALARATSGHPVWSLHDHLRGATQNHERNIARVIGDAIDPGDVPQATLARCGLV